MPAGSKFTVPVPLKQFFASFPLRIFGVENLEPSALFALRDIWAKLLLGNDALQVQFADSLK